MCPRVDEPMKRMIAFRINGNAFEVFTRNGVILKVDNGNTFGTLAILPAVELHCLSVNCNILPFLLQLPSYSG